MSVLGSVSAPPARRHTLRMVAVAAAAAVAALYVVLFVQLLPDLSETDNPAPAFAFLAVVYAVGAGLLAWLDRQWVHVTGAVVQVAVLAGYVSLFVNSATSGEGQFFVDHLLIGLGAAALQLVVLAVLVALALSGRAGAGAGARPPGRGSTPATGASP